MFHEPQGINFSSKEITAHELAWALCRTVSFLQFLEPHGVPLQKYHDWWEHDGLHFQKGSINFHELFRIVESPQSLLEAMPGDDNVFIGIAPDPNIWYLRFYLYWDEGGFDLLGRFDITLPTESAPQFKQRVLDSLDMQMQQQDAATFYNKIKL
jgi:hypothetical protein